MFISRERLKELLVSDLKMKVLSEFLRDHNPETLLALDVAHYNAKNKTKFKNHEEIAEYLIDNDKYHE